MNNLFLLIVTILYISSISVYWQSISNAYLALIFWISALLLSLFVAVINNKKVITAFFKKTFQKNKFFQCNIFLIAIILLATLLRFYSLTEIPILTHDEAKDTGLFPQKALNGQLTDYFGFYAGINNFFFVVSAIPHLLFSDPILKVRFFSAFFGVLSVILIYFFSNKLFTKRVAITAGVLLATYHVHIHFSRTEFLNLFDSFYTLVILLVFFLFVKAISRYTIVFLAIILGFGLHFYSGLRAFIIITTFFSFFCILYKKNILKEKILQFLIFSIFFFVALGPTIVVFLTRPQEALASGTATLIFSHKETWAAIMMLLTNYKNSILAYGLTPIDFHYHYGGPFLELPFSLLFILGVLLLLIKEKSKTSCLILLGLVGIPFFNSAIVEQVNYTHRLMSLVPLIIVSTAVGIEFVTITLEKAWGKTFAYPFLLTILVLFVYTNLSLYFINNVWEKTLFINEFRAWEAQRLIHGFSQKGTTVLFLGSPIMPSYKSVPPLEYLTKGYSIIDITAKDQFAQTLNTRKGIALLIILPENIAGIQSFNTSFSNHINMNKKIFYKELFLFDTVELSSPAYRL